MKIVSRSIIIAIIAFSVFYLFIYIMPDAFLTSSQWPLTILIVLIIAVVIDSIYKQRAYKNIVADYDKSLSIDPDDTIALNNKGTSLAEFIDHKKEALECFNKILEIDPNDAAALHNKGVVLDKMGKHQEALKYYDKALELDPRFKKGKKLGKVILEA